MTITPFSLIMSLLWCSIFTVLSYMLLRRKNFVVFFNVHILLFLMVLSLLRLAVNIDFPFAHIIHTTGAYPALMVFFDQPLCKLPFGNLYLRSADILIFLWAAGSIFFLCRFISQEYRFQKLMSGEPETQNPRLYLILEELSGGKATQIKIVETALVNAPMIAGLFHPVIFLPQLSLSEKDIRNILSHEWAHYIHKDVWCKLLVKLLCVLYWWNPLIYLLKHDLDHTLELKSDLYATRQMTETEKLDYLQTILLLAKKITIQKPAVSPTGLDFVSNSNGHPLKQRFCCVLDCKPPGKAQKLGIACLLLLMSILFAGSYCFILQPYSEPQEFTDGEIWDIPSTENGFLILNEDGTYSLYINNVFVGIISNNNEEPFASMPILTQEELQ